MSIAGQIFGLLTVCKLACLTLAFAPIERELAVERSSSDTAAELLPIHTAFPGSGNEQLFKEPVEA